MGLKSDFNFTLSAQAIKENYKVHILADLFLQNQHIKAVLQIYAARMQIFKLFTFCLRLICLIGIFFYFTFVYPDSWYYSGLFNFLFRGFNKTNLTMRSRTYATKLYTVKRVIKN